MDNYQQDIYEETFEKSYVINDSTSIERVKEEIKNLYTEDKGWTVEISEPIPTEDPRYVRLSVTIRRDRNKIQTSMFDELENKMNNTQPRR